MKWRFWAKEEPVPEPKDDDRDERDAMKKQQDDLLQRMVNLGLEADNLLRRK